MRNKKVMYVVTVDWFFCSHFLARAIYMKKQGYDVFVTTRLTTHAEVIRSHGIKLLPIKFTRSGVNPIFEIPTLFKLWLIYLRVRPDIIHHIALKPIVYGTFISRLSFKSHVVNAPVGMGFVFTSEMLKARLLRIALAVALKLLLNPKNSKVIFENKEDLKKAVGDKLVDDDDASLIRGAGVDTNKFKYFEEPELPVKVTCVSRMLWDKGIRELIEAAEILKKRDVKCVVNLVGDPDIHNPTSIDKNQLQAWVESGVIKWLGRIEDIPTVWANSHIAVLPSHREGLPKSLLEASSCGRPIVATDIAGCRELVTHNENGLLVPVKDSLALANAIDKLVFDSDLRAKMGTEGRKRVLESFSQEIIAEQTFILYESMQNKT